jgi:serine protease Do
MNDLSNGSKSRKPFLLAVLSLTLGVGIIVGTVISGHVGASRAFFEGSARTLSIPDPIIMSNAFSGIVNKLEPAVVNISTVQTIQAPQRRTTPSSPSQVIPVPPRGKGQNPGGNKQDPDPYQDFFDRFFDGGQDGPPADRTEQSLGSGIIVDPKGYILTNNHVVDQATRIKVQLNGSSQRYDAKVIGVDPDTDLAVIKIDYPHDLPIAKLGNSDGVQVGDWVLAIGSPFGLRATVTAGIISAKDRANIGEDQRQFQRFLQTDAAINPGNSGGPLVDMAGQVIGINTAILTGSRSTGNEGVGFALPSNIAINIYNQLVQSGHVVRGSIGVQFSAQDEISMNPVVLHRLGADYGVVIESVMPGGPADKAGLKVGDVLTKVNGKPVHSTAELVDPIIQTPVGNKVRISYIRDKQEHEVSIAVEDMSKIFPDRARNNSDARNPQSEPAAAMYGLHVEELTPDTAKALGIAAKGGVVVTRDPEPASFGEDLNFNRRDVIVEINEQQINNLADFKRIITTLKPGQEVVFKVLRSNGGNQQFTALLGGVVPASKQ